MVPYPYLCLYKHRVDGGIQDRKDTHQIAVSVEGWAEYPGRKVDEEVLRGSGKDWSHSDANRMSS